MDNLPPLSEIIERLIEAISWLTGFLPFLIALGAAALFSHAREEGTGETADTTTADIPPPIYASDERRRVEEESLEFGSSLFSEPDGSRESQWGSTFDQPWEKTKFGFDESEWGSTFEDNPDDTPRVYV